MAKDKDDDDDKTLDGVTLRPGIKGRPVTGTALTNAEKQASYRARKQKISVTVMISESEKIILDQWIENTGLTMSEIISTMIRLAKNNKDVGLL
jgi:hypothetical protein